MNIAVSPVQGALLTDPSASAPATHVLRVIGAQADIEYLGASVNRVLNAPESTEMPYWSINPYIGCAFGCAYCYARYAHRYAIDRAATAGQLSVATRERLALMPGWLAFEREILVKENAASALRLHRRSRAYRQRLLEGGETIVIGTATDPYQPAERRYRITRSLLDELGESDGLSIVIITKSPLVTRDVDVLARLTQRGSLTVHVSLITLDRDLARRLEPRAPTPDSRVRAVERLREAGIDVGVNVMPVLPGISDDPHKLDALIKRVAAAGATHVNCGALRLQSAARDRYLPFIEREFAHLADRYRTTYAVHTGIGERYALGLKAFIARACQVHGIPSSRRTEGKRALRERHVEDAQLGLAL
ncbi:MAG: hypothetical protein NVS1B4_03100 [Gemmatimonadaceae bacterium]